MDKGEDESKSIMKCRIRKRTPLKRKGGFLLTRVLKGYFCLSLLLSGAAGVKTM
jgi:hypothetical protein